MSRSGVTSAASADDAAMVTPARMNVVRRFMSSSQCAHPRARTDMNWVFIACRGHTATVKFTGLRHLLSAGRHPQHTTMSEMDGRTRDFWTWHYPAPAQVVG